MIRKFKMMLLTFGIIGSLLIIPEFGNAFAQTVQVQGIEFDTTQAGIVIILGVGAGFLVAYQGYRTTKEDWDTLKFFDGVIYAVLGAVPLAIGTAIIQTNLGIFEYVIVFFGAVGIGSQIQKTRKSTIPSNEG